MKEVARRSLFHFTAVKQLDFALQSFGDKTSPEFLHMVRSKVSGMISTQAVEGWNGLQKTQTMYEVPRNSDVLNGG